jgi:hypothetical protein
MDRPTAPPSNLKEFREMHDDSAFIGRVTRCSIQGFVGAVRIPEPDAPTFGSFCVVSAPASDTAIIAVIYDIGIEDDAFARQLATAEGLTEEQLADSQSNRQVPVEFSALTIGYEKEQRYHQALPAQPPLTLAPIYRMPPEDILRFTADLRFLPWIASSANLPTDDLLVATLKTAAEARHVGERGTFIKDAGRACARLLQAELRRLEYVLHGLSS